MDFQVIRSARRTLVAEIKKDGSVLVRAPRFCSPRLIEDFILRNEEKILKKQEAMRTLPKTPAITKEQMEEMRKYAKEHILPRVDELGKKYGFRYKSVRITSARTRFGSCSGTGGISLSLFLSLLDDKEIDYVILHELCHTKEHNHSVRFYQLVESYMPDWKERENRLKKIIIPEVLE